MKPINYILLDITEELKLLQKTITNPLDLQNILMDLFSCISYNEKIDHYNINFTLFLDTKFFYFQWVNSPEIVLTQEGINLINILEKIKDNIIAKLFDHRLDIDSLQYYFKSLHGNRVLLQRLTE